MRAKIVTYDVYMALLDIEGSLTSVVRDGLGLDNGTAAAFVKLWRTKQMERAAASNSLGQGRTSFRDCTAMALDYSLFRHDLTASQETRQDLIYAWDCIKPWPEAGAAIAAVKAAMEG